VGQRLHVIPPSGLGAELLIPPIPRFCYLLPMEPTNTTNNNIITSISAETWPRVKVGTSQILEVKWGFFPRFLLSNWGLSLDNILAAMRSIRTVTPEVKDEAGEVVTAAVLAVDDPGYTARMMELFAAMVGHNYTQIGQTPPSAMHWATQIDEGQWIECLKAMMLAMGKETAARKAAQAPLPEKTEQAQTIPTLQ